MKVLAGMVCGIIVGLIAVAMENIFERPVAATIIMYLMIADGLILTVLNFFALAFWSILFTLWTAVSLVSVDCAAFCLVYILYGILFALLCKGVCKGFAAIQHKFKQPARR